jgi:hypothetical protein
MKIMGKVAAQGEAFFRRLDDIPETVKQVHPENGVVIVAHSETGHHHVMDASNVTLLERTDPLGEGLRILHMIVKEPTEHEHLRSHDTHEPIMFPAGNYEVRLQREYTPEGFRRVAD